MCMDLTLTSSINMSSSWSKKNTWKRRSTGHLSNSVTIKSVLTWLKENWVSFHYLMRCVMVDKHCFFNKTNDKMCDRNRDCHQQQIKAFVKSSTPTLTSLNTMISSRSHVSQIKLSQLPIMLMMSSMKPRTLLTRTRILFLMSICPSWTHQTLSFWDKSLTRLLVPILLPR